MFWSSYSLYSCVQLKFKTYLRKWNHWSKSKRSMSNRMYISLPKLMTDFDDLAFYHSSLLCLLAHRAGTNLFHYSRSFAFLSTVPQMNPLSLILFSIVRRHVVFGLPLFPSDVHLRPTLIMSSDVLRRTWPCHLHLFCTCKVSMSLAFVIVCRSLLETFSGQKMFWWLNDLPLSAVELSLLSTFIAKFCPL